jgi:hypothetical protein
MPVGPEDALHGPEHERAETVARRGRAFGRPFLLAVGWLMVGLGFVGVFVPGLPTVPFLLVALWAFSKSSDRFHDWLYNHPRLGPPLRDWREHGAIPARAKIVAVATMAASFIWVTFGIAEDWVLPTVLAACLIPAAAFILTRPSR